MPVFSATALLLHNDHTNNYPHVHTTPGIGIEQSFGLAIVSFTLAVKTLLIPLQVIQLQSSEKMQALAPTVKEINAKFGQNKEAATAATNRLYSETKVNPLIGCLPALLQVRSFVFARDLFLLCIFAF